VGTVSRKMRNVDNLQAVPCRAAVGAVAPTNGVHGLSFETEAPSLA